MPNRESPIKPKKKEAWSLIPTRKQWKIWSLTGKASYVGVWLAVLGLGLAIFMYFFPWSEVKMRIVQPSILDTQSNMLLAQVLLSSSEENFQVELFLHNRTNFDQLVNVVELHILSPKDLNNAIQKFLILPEMSKKFELSKDVYFDGTVLEFRYFRGVDRTYSYTARGRSDGNSLHDGFSLRMEVAAVLPPSKITSLELVLPKEFEIKTKNVQTHPSKSLFSNGILFIALNSGSTENRRNSLFAAIQLRP